MSRLYNMLVASTVTGLAEYAQIKTPVRERPVSTTTEGIILTLCNRYLPMVEDKRTRLLVLSEIHRRGKGKQKFLDQELYNYSVTDNEVLALVKLRNNDQERYAEVITDAFYMHPNKKDKDALTVVAGSFLQDYPAYKTKIYAYITPKERKLWTWET